MNTKSWAFGLMSGAVMAAAAHAQTVDIQDAWVRATVAGQQATGAFMNITADQDMTLIGVSSPVAGVSQVHEMSMQNDIMRMSEMKAGLPLPAGQTVTLKPGGYHLMLMDLKQAVEVGQQVQVSLTLRDAQGQTSQRDLTLPAKPLAMKHGQGMKHKQGMSHSHGD